MKRVVLGVAALVAALSLTGGSAIAAGTAASCVVGGATGSLTPSVQQVGGSGTFTFSGTVVCQVNGGPVVGTISASGSYSNTVCGTGTADGTASIPGLGSRSFHIQFVAGTGAVFVPDSSPTNAAGAVELVPTGPDTSPGACVKQFTVVGAFSVN